MAEETIDKNFMIAIAALSSVDASGLNETEWLQAIAKRANYIKGTRMLDEGSFIMNTLDSVKIPATIKSVEFEKSSERYVITFEAVYHDDNEEQKEETIRTPRMDRKDGKIIENQIEKLKQIAGTDQRVIIYKHNELPTDTTKKPGRRNTPSTGYRVAVWFDFPRR